jgi:hypothetical protein
VADEPERNPDWRVLLAITLVVLGVALVLALAPF